MPQPRANLIWHKNESSSSCNKYSIRGSSRKTCAFRRGASGTTYLRTIQSRFRTAPARPKGDPSLPNNTRSKSSPKIADSNVPCSQVWCRVKGPTSSRKKTITRAPVSTTRKTTPSWIAHTDRASSWVRSKPFHLGPTTRNLTTTRATYGCTRKRPTPTSHLTRWI